MFRKPKKKPSALRNKQTSSSNHSSNRATSTATTNNDATTFAGKKRRRIARRNSSSSSEEDNNNNNNNNNDDDEGEEGTTSDILQQIRKEREDALKSKKTPGGSIGASSSSSSIPRLNTSTTMTKKKKNKNNWMHQYKSTNDGERMSAQEMATRGAEYHPTNDDGPSATSNAAANSDNGDGDGNDDGNNNNNNNNNLPKDATTQNAATLLATRTPRSKFLAGPLRATTFVRTTVRFDYQPDICKDYKETGFCGFGDSCIYLHDRGDTKSGWQMEAEYEERKKKEEGRKGREMEEFMRSMMCGGGGGKDGKVDGTVDGGRMALSGDGEGGSGKGSSSSEDDGIPFACHLSRRPFENPIVTTCGHYFNEKDMMDRIRTVGTGCPICQKDTHGVMNYPTKLVAKKRRLVGRDGTWEEYFEMSKVGGGGGDAD